MVNKPMCAPPQRWRFSSYIGADELKTTVDAQASTAGNNSPPNPIGGVFSELDEMFDSKTPANHSIHHLDSHEMDPSIVKLREDLEHERNRRYNLIDSVR